MRHFFSLSDSLSLASGRPEPNICFQRSVRHKSVLKLVKWSDAGKMVGQELFLEEDMIKCATPWHNPKTDFTGADVILHDCGVRMAKARREQLPPMSFRLLQLYQHAQFLDADATVPLDECAICERNFLNSKHIIRTCSRCLNSCHAMCACYTLRMHMVVVGMF